MDGVLVDTEPVHMNSFNIFLAQFGIETDPKYVEGMIGISIEENIEMILKDFPQHKDEILKTNPVKYRNDLYLQLLSNTKLSPIPGIEELIDHCKAKKLKLGLASSSDREQIDAILSNLNSGTTKINWPTIFDTIVAGDSVKQKKPFPDIYQKALDNIGCQAAHAIALEDSQAGVTSAKQAGLYAVALRNPYFDADKMDDVDLIVDSVDALVRLL
jgi:beta-phosphoglucomutase-like phosphatase (HAD superfamily)